MYYYNTYSSHTHTHTQDPPICSLERRRFENDFAENQRTRVPSSRFFFVLNSVAVDILRIESHGSIWRIIVAYKMWIPVVPARADKSTLDTLRSQSSDYCRHVRNTRKGSNRTKLCTQLTNTNEFFFLALAFHSTTTAATNGLRTEIAHV